MNKGKTLRELYQQKQKKKYTLLTIFPIIVISTLLYGLFSYTDLFGENSESILGEDKTIEKDIVIQEDSLAEEFDSVNIPETIIEETETANDVETTEKTTVKKTAITENKTDTIENISETTKPNYCSDSDISIYKQIISTSNSAIKSANTYISNPTCNYPYTPSSCNLTYDNCVRSVQNWYEADGTCSRLPRSGLCASLNQERYYRLEQCEENKISCNNTCETEKEQELLKRLSEISYREGLIIVNEQKLSDCGVL